MGQHYSNKGRYDVENIEKAFINLNLLSEIGRGITANLSIEKIGEAVYQNVNDLMDAAVFGIGIFNKQKNTIEFQFARERGKALKYLFFHLEKDNNRLAVWCYQHKKDILINDLQSEYKLYVDEILPTKTGDHAQSILYVPILFKDKAVGVITVQSFMKKAYTQYHLNMLRNISIYTAIALENAAAYQEITDKSKKLEKTLKELQNTQMQLVHAEKLASLGELTAGIAHEINNPVNFVQAGVESLQHLLSDFWLIFNKYQELDQVQDEKQLKLLLQNIIKHKEELELDETRALIEEVIKAIKEGAVRIIDIVKGLRDFSLPEATESKWVDIHENLDKTLLLLKSKYKTYIDIHTNYDTQVGHIQCYPSQLNQVFLNIIKNAIQAIKERGQITITTKNHNNYITIRIKDSGQGMSEKVRSRIFEPFFTTKGVGEGTGLGLAISYGIIQKHKGKIEVKSEPGAGCEFMITLPKKI